MKKEDFYKIAVDTRKFEIQLFWQRSNYFLALNSAVAIGFFSIDNPLHSKALAIFGIIVSILWVFVNFGSKYWQTRWEERASILESEVDKDQEEGQKANLFSVNKEVIQNDVKSFLLKYKQKKELSLYDKLILFKPSVSKAATLLSIVFVIFWLFIFVSSFINKPNDHSVKIENVNKGEER